MEGKFILKHAVYNEIDFPIGTIVELIQQNTYGFMVAEGDLKDKKGFVADGLDGYLIADNKKNRKLVEDFLIKREKISRESKTLKDHWEAIPTVYLSK